MNRKTILSSLLVCGLGLIAVAEAQAGPRGWDFGGAFRVGGLSFSIGYGSHDSLRSDYYYRVNAPLVHPRRACGRSCFRQGDAHYHHVSCPALRAHFDRHGQDLRYSLERFGPVISASWSYRSPGSYYTYQRPRGRSGKRGKRGVPRGHLPPPGLCRVWYDGVPPGHQPPPMRCDEAYYHLPRHGARIVHGGRRH